VIQLDQPCILPKTKVLIALEIMLRIKRMLASLGELNFGSQLLNHVVLSISESNDSGVNRSCREICTKHAFQETVLVLKELGGHGRVLVDRADQNAQYELQKQTCL
jgi:hypothetical protein